MGDQTVHRLEAAADASGEVLPEQWLTYQATDEADAERYMDFSGASSPRRIGLAIEYRVGGAFQFQR